MPEQAQAPQASKPAETARSSQTPKLAEAFRTPGVSRASGVPQPSSAPAPFEASACSCQNLASRAAPFSLAPPLAGPAGQTEPSIGAKYRRQQPRAERHPSPHSSGRRGRGTESHPAPSSRKTAAGGNRDNAGIPGCAERIPTARARHSHQSDYKRPPRVGAERLRNGIDRSRGCGPPIF